MKKRYFCFLLCCLVGSNYTLAKQTYAINDKAWSLKGKGAVIEEKAGVEAIKIARGQAILNDVEFENGTIEFNVYLPKERAFAYLYFRGQSDQEFEEIYLRTHKSKAPDALQYAPVFQRRAAWQLYHGDRGTAAASFPAEQWVPVKVKLDGPTLQVWVGQSEEPIMTVDRMGREPKAGWIGYRGFVPSTSEAKFSAYFSAITLTPSEQTDANSSAIKTDLPEGQITHWRVSPAFKSKPGPISEIPSDVTNAQWIVPQTQPDGSYELLRSIEVPKGVRHWSSVAEVELYSEDAQTCELLMGFSDQITLSLNGRKMLYQDARYSFDKPRRQGLMYQDQLRVYLPLNKGKNVLRAIISDNFGGWGFISKLQGCTGVVPR